MSNDRIDQEYEHLNAALEKGGDDAKRKRQFALGVSAVALAVLGFGGWKMMGATGSAAGMAQANAAQAGNAFAPDSIIATVNGQSVTEGEIVGIVQSGIDKAIVIDRYINKVLAAERAREMYSKEADTALKAAEREVLSTLYTTRRMQELRDAVSEEDIKAYYAKNVLDENFKLWKVSYYLSTNPQDVQTTLNSMQQGDAKALAQLKPLIEQGDGFAATSALPYNLGRVVAKMKKGEFSEVLQLRNGLLVLRLEEVKQLEKPKLESVKQEIVQAIALQKFNEELEQVRRQAKVELS